MELSHVDERGRARMVDVTEKVTTSRRAVAIAHISMKPETLELIKNMEIRKGDVLAAARIAGIMAAKKTPELIPLCHPLTISGAAVEFEFYGTDQLIVSAEVKCTGPTGVEMEALTAASIAVLTVYDMCKAVDKGMTIERIYLETKEGGKSGTYRRLDG
ncbi:cyclic pyranopterin monophosphate synthase MoaC [Dehalogenimonas alkenigignens]|nr:cyclic pyranopterin monophosphate synthase MoaC [Dehalogenimonas alkenigignens]PVV85058.1 cyclic pyranopterin monophosphate synthase MoaC [Dehalogenimonas alkenigignens]